MQLLDVVPDFEEWPKRWVREERDLEYGRDLLESMRPFAESLIASKLSTRVTKDHLDSLWLLGGEIIRDVGMSNEYHVPPIKKIRQSVDREGGPACRHLHSRSEATSFHRTCRRLAKYVGAE